MAGLSLVGTQLQGLSLFELGAADGQELLAWTYPSLDEDTEAVLKKVRGAQPGSRMAPLP